ncbi:MAG: DUF58 domain-containing protein [Acidobacteriota bacterium]
MLVLSFSLGLAVVGAAARQSGFYRLSIVLSLVALAAVVLVALGFLPRLLRRISEEYWQGFRHLRVTRRGILFLLLVLLIAFSTFNTGNNLLVLVLSFLLAALLVSGVASNLSLHGLRLTVNLPTSVHAGQTVAALVTLANEKRWLPSFSLTLRTHEPGVPSAGAANGGPSRLFPYLPARASHTERLEFRCLHRGVYPLRGFEVHTRFPFGFVSRGRELPVDGGITVYPALVDVRTLMRTHPCLQGGESGRRKGTGSGLYNVRDYRRGDSSRFIHWKATAKLSKLMVKEFIEERDDSFQLVLSTYLPDPGDHARQQFEKALSWVASLAVAHLHENKAFRFYSGEFETEVDGDREELTGLLEYLAWVQPAEQLLLEPTRISAGAVVLAAGNSFKFGDCPVIDYLEI